MRFLGFINFFYVILFSGAIANATDKRSCDQLLFNQYVSYVVSVIPSESYSPNAATEFFSNGVGTSNYFVRIFRDAPFDVDDYRNRMEFLKQQTPGSKIITSSILQKSAISSLYDQVGSHLPNLNIGRVSFGVVAVVEGEEYRWKSNDVMPSMSFPKSKQTRLRYEASKLRELADNVGFDRDDLYFFVNRRGKLTCALGRLNPD